MSKLLVEVARIPLWSFVSLSVLIILAVTLYFWLKE